MIEEEINKTVEVLRKGGIIVYPTDTIWGIGCDATNDKAVKKVYALKKRFEKKNMLVLICKKESIEKFIDEVPSIAYDLIDSWHKSLTIVYDGAKNLAKSLIKGDKTIGIRVSQDEFSRRVIEKFGKPLVTTSANVSGESTPLFYKDISPEIINGVDYVVNLYHHSMNDVKASTIIRLHSDGNFEVLRP